MAQLKPVQESAGILAALKRLRFDAPVQPGWIAFAAAGLIALYLMALPTVGTAALRNATLGCAVIMTASAVLRRQLEPRFPLAIWWLPYAAVGLWSLTYALDPRYSFNELTSDIGYSLLTIFVVASWTQTAADRSRLTAGAAVAFAAIVATSTYVSIKSGGELRSLESTGPLHLYVGELSTYIVMFLPFHAALLILSRSRTQGAVLLFVAAGAIFLLYATGNRIAPFAVAASVLAYSALLFLGAPKAAWKIVAGAVLALAISLGLAAMLLQERTPSGQTMLGGLTADPRVMLWHAARDNLAQEPWRGGGYGLRTFALRDPGISASDSNYWHAHNPLLNRGVQMGWPGIASFVFLYLATIVTLLRTWRRASSPPDRIFVAAALSSTAAMIVKNVTDDFTVRQFNWLYWALLACAIGPTLVRQTGAIRKIGGHTQ